MTRPTHVLITGSGGRLGKLLRAARDREGTGQNDVVFQSCEPGTDIQWIPGDALDALPRSTMLVPLWGVTQGAPDALAKNSALAELTREIATHGQATYVDGPVLAIAVFGL